MPTKKPRLTISLDHNVYNTLSEMAKIQGLTKASIINDLLLAVHEPMMRTVALLQAASDAPEEVRRNLEGAVIQLEKELNDSLRNGSSQLDILRDQLGIKDTSSPSALRSEKL